MTAQDITFRIPDMHCEGCTQRLTNVLERLRSVQSVQVTLEDKRATARYDAGSTGFDKMKEAVEKAGYTVERG